MPKLLNGDDLLRAHEKARKDLLKRQQTGATIFIGMGTCGVAAGAAEIESLIRQELSQRNLEAEVVPVGCIGMCFKEPLVDIQLPGQPRVTYGNIGPERVPRLIEEHLVKGAPVKQWVVGKLVDW